MRVSRLCSLLMLALICLPAPAASGPWDMSSLQKPPSVQWLNKEGPVRSLYFEGEPFRGNPTLVFAYFALPEHHPGRVPAMVLVHGGAGRAFPQWASMWAQRGYAAISMDLSGNGPDGKRMRDGGPSETDQVIFFDSMPTQDAWVYHAVADIVRAISFLEQQPEVDPNRIGITGISWGGFLTAIVAGLDPRLKVAIPIYGCGFIYENSVWKTIFENISPAMRQSWIENFDPSRYLPGAHLPMLWITGTNDFAYPLNIFQKSYRLAPGPHYLRVMPRMPHGHSEGWAPLEICIMADQVLKGATPLIRIEKEERIENQARVTFSSALAINAASLEYTLDGTNWIDRAWDSLPLVVRGNQVTALLPAGRPLTYFINLTDARGAVVSTEHRELWH
ncbi:MAG: alpha/beta fold hydrolase [Acidobacteriaceae bacterium]|nr:alpha/beta fold hydrolase [Acidobacteriaceae bacterium]